MGLKAFGMQPNCAAALNRWLNPLLVELLVLLLSLADKMGAQKVGSFGDSAGRLENV